VCCLSVGAVFIATLLSPVAPAGADQVSDLQSQAAELSQEMLLEQMQIGGYQQQRAADMAQVAQDQQVLSATQAQVVSTHRRIDRDLSELDHAAVRAYIDDGTQSNATNPLFSSYRSADVSAVYEQVMTGDLSDAMDQLRTDRHALVVEETTEDQVVAQAQQEATQAAILLAEAQSTQEMLQAQSAQVNGQLAAAIAQQQAAEEAQAAAALAAAQARSAQQASQTGVVATSSLSLPPFLACVVQAESSGNYGAVSPTGTYMGAFQFSQATWNDAALLSGRPTLVGVPPNEASPADQDELAIALYTVDGQVPWYDPCRSG
jgi:Transglycosylase-like domain